MSDGLILGSGSGSIWNWFFHFSTQIGTCQSILPDPGPELLPVRPARDRQIRLTRRQSRMQPIAGAIEDIVEGLPGCLLSLAAPLASHGPTVQPADTLSPRLLPSIFVPIDMPAGSKSILASLMRNPGDFSLRLSCRHPHRDHSIPRLIVHLHAPRFPGWPKSRRRCRACHCSEPVYPVSNPRRKSADHPSPIG